MPVEEGIIFAVLVFELILFVMGFVLGYRQNELEEKIDRHIADFEHAHKL